MYADTGSGFENAHLTNPRLAKTARTRHPHVQRRLDRRQVFPENGCVFTIFALHPATLNLEQRVSGGAVRILFSVQMGVYLSRTYPCTCHGVCYDAYRSYGCFVIVIPVWEVPPSAQWWEQ